MCVCVSECTCVVGAARARCTLCARGSMYVCVYVYGVCMPHRVCGCRRLHRRSHIKFNSWTAIWSMVHDWLEDEIFHVQSFMSYRFIRSFHRFREIPVAYNCPLCKQESSQPEHYSAYKGGGEVGGGLTFLSVFGFSIIFLTVFPPVDEQARGNGGRFSTWTKARRVDVLLDRSLSLLLSSQEESVVRKIKT